MMALSLNCLAHRAILRAVCKRFAADHDLAILCSSGSSDPRGRDFFKLCAAYRHALAKSVA